MVYTVGVGECTVLWFDDCGGFGGFGAILKVFGRLKVDTVVLWEGSALVVWDDMDCAVNCVLEGSCRMIFIFI